MEGGGQGSPPCMERWWGAPLGGQACKEKGMSSSSEAREEKVFPDALEPGVQGQDQAEMCWSFSHNGWRKSAVSGL